MAYQTGLPGFDYLFGLSDGIYPDLITCMAYQTGFTRIWLLVWSIRRDLSGFDYLYGLLDRIYPDLITCMAYQTGFTRIWLLVCPIRRNLPGFDYLYGLSDEIYLHLITCMAYQTGFTRIWLLLWPIRRNLPVCTSLQIQFGIVHRMIIHEFENLTLFEDGYLSPFWNCWSKRFEGWYLRYYFCDPPGHLRLNWPLIEAVFRTVFRWNWSTAKVCYRPFIFFYLY